MSDITIQILTFLAGNATGFILGWVTHRLTAKKDIANSERTVISFVVLFVWVISVFFDISSAEYTTPFPIHGIFGAIVGYFYQQSLSDIFKGGKK